MKKAFLLFSITLIAFWSIQCNKSSNSSVTATAKDSLSFIVLGDWGVKGAHSQKKVAEQMFRKGRQHNIQFVITTGDNFYPVGVSDIKDAHWQLSYENIYLKDSLPVKWFPVLGNHDYQSNPQAEIEYSTVNNQWNMPGRFYSINRKISADIAALFLFTDTSPFVTEYYNPVLSMADLRTQDTSAQTRWIESTLNSSKEAWKIVIGHHPIYSGGTHGNTPELIQRLKPILVKNNVDLYLAGHDHHLEEAKQPGEKLYYFVSGGGFENRSITPTSNTIFAKSTTGFLIITLYSNKGLIYFYDKEGTLLFQQEINK